MTTSRLAYLFNRYIQNDFTEQEKAELLSLLGKPENESEAKKLIDSFVASSQPSLQLPDGAPEMMLENIFQKAGVKERITIKRRNVAYSWMRVAAAFVIVMGAYWFADWQKQNESVAKVEFQKDPVITPGRNRALLTIDGKKTIVLDSIPNGTLGAGATAFKKQPGLLVYDQAGGAKHKDEVVYSTLSTPRAGQYAVVLADGSKVWLNAQSTLRFPSAFTGGQRVVDLSGEAYFEVAKNKEQPFIVNVNAMQVRVLGTHFNVNAYADEKYVKTSLLEGSVRVAKDGKVHLLAPGEQGILDVKLDMVTIKTVDMDEVIAWKNGLFQFEDQNIFAIMRQISRWYDVEVVYSGKIPERRFNGKISRDAELQDVLRILELSNLKFKVEGKKIEVL